MSIIFLRSHFFPFVSRRCIAGRGGFFLVAVGAALQAAFGAASADSTLVVAIGRAGAFRVWHLGAKICLARRTLQ